MERLTKRYIDEDDGSKSIGIFNGCIVPEICFEEERGYRVFEKLADYEDAEEQGLLVKLPCKVGDTVYVPTRNFVSELRITLVSIDTNDMTMYFGWLLNSGIYPNLDGFFGYELGKTVFLTHEEAEKKLEEMKK